MLLSVFYVLSASVLFWVFYFIPKAEKPLNGIHWFFLGYMAYATWNSFLAGFLKPFTGVDIGIYGAANLILAFFLWRFCLRGKKHQKYSFKVQNGVYVFGIFLMAFIIGWIQFGGFKTISFMVTDPAVIFKSSYDAMAEIGFMYHIEVENAIIFQIFSPWVSRIEMWKIFIGIETWRFALSGIYGLVFLERYCKTATSKIMAAVLAAVYMLGYPLTNLIYGFTHMGYAIVIFLYILCVSNLLINEEINITWAKILLCGGFLSLAVCYVLFVPAAFIGTFLGFTLYYWKKNKKVTVDYIFSMIEIYLIPCIYGLLFSVFIGSSPISNGVSVIEGANYKMLYGNFVILLPFVIYGFFIIKRQKINDILSTVLPISIIIAAGMFFLTTKGYLSTYYLYKIQFFLAPLIWMISYLAAEEILKKEPVFIYLLCIILVGTLGIRFLKEKISPASTFKTDELASVVDIYDYNFSYLNSPYEFLNESFIEACQEAQKWQQEYPQENLAVCGSSLHVFWYNALLGQEGYSLYGPDLSQEVLQKEYGDHALVFSLQHNLALQNEALWGEQEVLWENACARLVKIIQ